MTVTLIDGKYYSVMVSETCSERMTLATAPAVSDHVWDVAEIVSLIDSF